MDLEPHPVGLLVGVLQLGAALGLDATQVVVDLLLRTLLVPAELLGHDLGDPRCGAYAAVEGLHRNPGAALQHVVEVAGALVVDGVDDLGGEIVLGALELQRERTTLRDEVEHVVDQAAVTPEEVVDATDVEPGATGEQDPLVRTGLEALRTGLHVGRIDHLLGRHGGLIDDVLDLIAQRRPLALQLEGAEDYLAAEVVYAVNNEGARHLDDVLERRTRIAMETFDRGVRAAPGVAKIMAEELGWDGQRTQEEVDHYLRRIEAERRSQLEDTDEEADRVRLEVQDLV